MAEKELHDLSVREAGERLRSGRLTSEALTRHALERIGRFDPRINAFVTLTADRALDDARRADRELGAGKDRGPLHGIPLGIKDIYDTAGIRTTCCSKVRVDNVPAEDSEVARRLKEAGTVLLGKLATSEFAMASPDFGLPFPPARNPWNPDHVPSGSSSGSGASIAARFARISMGSDTTGSIRGPAGACGIVGLKPTYGRVSLRGIFPLAYSLDHPGPMARTVEDAALVLQATAGYDPGDAASADVPVPDYLGDLEKGVKGLRIGWPRRFISGFTNALPEVTAAIDGMAWKLADSGATVEEIELPENALFATAAHVIMLSESFEIHSENLRKRAGDYGILTGPRTMIGSVLSAEDYGRAKRLRRYLADKVNALWDRYDALLVPGNTGTAARMDARTRPPPAMGTSAIFNVSGTPAMSIPVGLVGGLPIAVGVATGPFEEAMAFRVGRTIERLSGWAEVGLPELQ